MFEFMIVFVTGRDYESLISRMHRAWGDNRLNDLNFAVEQIQLKCICNGVIMRNKV